jgi:hypothetical protein
MFDFIILAIGDRFEEFDARILEDCARCKVPTFIVRSKADQHIANSMKDDGIGYSEIATNPQKYETCRNKFISDSRQAPAALSSTGQAPQSTTAAARECKPQAAPQIAPECAKGSIHTRTHE